MDSDSSNITRWFVDLKAGDTGLATRIWAQYSSQLAAVARRRLAGVPLRVADEEDVVVVAFAAFLRGMRHDGFFKIDNRRDLWQALVVLVECAARDIRRKHFALKRGGGHVRGESVFNLTDHDESVGGLAQIPAGPPGPQYAEIMLELAERRFGELTDPQLRRIAHLKIEGYRTTDIAKQLEISARSVERKINLIRVIWKRDEGLDS